MRKTYPKKHRARGRNWKVRNLNIEAPDKPLKRAELEKTEAELELFMQVQCGDGVIVLMSYSEMTVEICYVIGLFLRPYLTSRPLQDLEEDPEMRKNVNMYKKDPIKARPAPSTMDDSDDEAEAMPELENLLEDITYAPTHLCFNPCTHAWHSARIHLEAHVHTCTLPRAPRLNDKEAPDDGDDTDFEGEGDIDFTSGAATFNANTRE